MQNARHFKAFQIYWLIHAIEFTYHDNSVSMDATYTVCCDESFKEDL